jgi:hypothetical protein
MFDFLVSDLKEKSTCLKFCFKVGKTTSATCEMLNVAFCYQTQFLSVAKSLLPMSEESKVSHTQHQKLVHELF